VEKIIEYTDLLYKLKYVCIDNLIDETVLDVDGFKIEYRLTDKNFKYIKKNIVFHFLFLNVLKLLKNIVTEDSYKPVLFVSCEKIIKDNTLEDQLKLLKKLLPIPVLLSLDQDIIFKGFPGPLKELNSKVLSFYQKRKVKLKDLKKYFDDKGFSALSHTLSSVVDLKGFYY